MSEACKDCKHYDGKYCDEDGKIHDRYDSCKDYAEQRMTKNNKTLDFFAYTDNSDIVTNGNFL